MPENSPSTGEVVAHYRYRRHLTQEQLAEAAGLSLSMVKAVERGSRTPRMATLNKLAHALGVRTSDLLVPTSGVHVAPDTDPDALLAVRRALNPPLGVDVEPGPVADPAAWAHTLACAERLYAEDRYEAVLAAVPVLLEEASAIYAADPAQAAVLAQAHMYAAQVLTQVRQLDLANHALDKAMRLANELSDELMAACIAPIQCWTLLLQRRFNDVELLAVQTADRIEPRMSGPASPQLVTWGWLMVRAASAAVRDARYDDAEEYMSQARSVAARLGDGVQPVTWLPMLTRNFGIPAVGFKDVENAVLLGDHGKALALAERVPPSETPSVNSRNRHQLDIASAYLALHRPAAAVETLLDVRHAAPEWLRHQSYARGIIGQLVETRRRAYADEVGLLADHVGVGL